MGNFFDKARRAINQLEVMVNTISMPKVKAGEENNSEPLTEQSSSLTGKTVLSAEAQGG